MKDQRNINMRQIYSMIHTEALIWFFYFHVFSVFFSVYLTSSCSIADASAIPA